MVRSWSTAYEGFLGTNSHALTIALECRQFSPTYHSLVLIDLRSSFPKSKKKPKKHQNLMAGIIQLMAANNSNFIRLLLYFPIHHFQVRAAHTDWKEPTKKKAKTRIRGLGRDGLGYWSIDEASLLNCQWLMEATLMKQNSIIPVEWSSSGVRWWCGDGSERKTIAALPTTKVLACLFGRRGMINEGSIFEKWIIMMKYFSRW